MKQSSFNPRFIKWHYHPPPQTLAPSSFTIFIPILINPSHHCLFPGHLQFLCLYFSHFASYSFHTTGRSLKVRSYYPPTLKLFSSFPSHSAQSSSLSSDAEDLHRLDPGSFFHFISQQPYSSCPWKCACSCLKPLRIAVLFEKFFHQIIIQLNFSLISGNWNFWLFLTKGDKMIWKVKNFHLPFFSYTLLGHLYPSYFYQDTLTSEVLISTYLFLIFPKHMLILSPFLISVLEDVVFW